MVKDARFRNPVQSRNSDPRCKHAGSLGCLHIPTIAPYHAHDGSALNSRAAIRSRSEPAPLASLLPSMMIASAAPGHRSRRRPVRANSRSQP